MRSEVIIKWIKRGIKFIVLPIIGIITLFLLYNLLNIKFAGYKLNEISDEDTMKYSIYGPNLTIGRREKTMEGCFKYKYKAYIQRNILGNIIFEDEKEVVGGIFPSYKSIESLNEYQEIEDLQRNKRVNSLGGEKKLIFIRPNKIKKEINDDREKIKEFEEDEIIEVAISFDKEYELQIIKENYITDKTTFLWVDDKSLLGNENDEKFFLGDEAFGIKVDEENNEDTEMKNGRGIEEKFIESLRALKESNKGYEESYLKLAGEDEELVKEDIFISGISLIGNKKEVEKYIANKITKYVFIGNVMEKR